MGKIYEVLFYCGNRLFSAYYVIDGIEGETLENGLISLKDLVRKGAGNYAERQYKF